MQFDPGARPALMSTGSLLLAAAVGPTDRFASGHDRSRAVDDGCAGGGGCDGVDCAIRSRRARTDRVQRRGGGGGSQNTVRAATRPISGGSWTPLIPLLSLVAISPLGGVTVVSIDLGVMAIAVGVDGVVCSALSVDGLIWSPLIPQPS